MCEFLSGQFCSAIGGCNRWLSASDLRPSRPVSVLAAGFFNNDGIPDLAVGSYSGASIEIGNGDGTFQVPTSVFTGGSVVSLAVGDLNANSTRWLAKAASQAPGS